MKDQTKMIATTKLTIKVKLIGTSTWPHKNSTKAHHSPNRKRKGHTTNAQVPPYDKGLLETEEYKTE